jgi:hypothetical protein
MNRRHGRIGQSADWRKVFMSLDELFAFSGTGTGALTLRAEWASTIRR